MRKSTLTAWPSRSIRARKLPSWGRRFSAMSSLLRIFSRDRILARSWLICSAEDAEGELLEHAVDAKARAHPAIHHLEVDVGSAVVDGHA